MYVCMLEGKHRSPWSNRYDPPLSDGAVPSYRLRRLEIEANQALTLTENRECWEGVGSAGGQADRDGYSKISVTIPHSNNGQRNWSGWFVISLTRSRACKKNQNC